MAFFTKPHSTAHSVLAPLSRERFRAVMDRVQMNYATDDDGDAYGFWGDGHPVMVMALGPEQEVMQIRALWARPVEEGDVARLRDLIESWCQQKLWPKAYLRVGEDKVLSVAAEHALMCRAGISDEQIEEQLSVGIDSAMLLFEYLDEQFPERVAQAAAMRAEREAED